jgi:monoterpene epsilon-lactone hydrolase
MSIQNFLVSRAIKTATKASLKFTPEQRLKRSRKFMAANNSNVPDNITVQPKTIAGVKVEWVMPDQLVKDKLAKICLYFHGGGYISGGMNSHRDMACYLAKKANIKMLMVDYRLAPEYPYPAAHDDALAVYNAILAQGVNSQNITIGGDSAGANLALATLQSIRDKNLSAPAKAILYSPWVDLTHTNSSYLRNEKKDVMLNTQILTEAAEFYAQKFDVNNEKISPLFAPMNNLPPMQIYVSKIEVLVDDAKQLHEKLIAAGVKSEYLEWRSAPHAFPIFCRIIPEGKKALNKSAKFINSH